jgi:hypothetical protein
MGAEYKLRCELLGHQEDVSDGDNGIQSDVAVMECMRRTDLWWRSCAARRTRTRLT